MTHLRKVRAFGLVALVCAVVFGVVALTAPSTSAASVMLTVVGDEEADPIDLGTGSFEDVSAALAALPPGTELALNLPGLPGETVDTFAVEGASVVLTGTSSAGPLMVIATWSGATADIVFAVDGADRALGSLGLSGALAGNSFPDTLFLSGAHGAAVTMSEGTLPAAATAFLGGLHPGAGSGQISLGAGVNFGAQLSLSALPAPIAAVLDGSDVLLTGTLGGADFSILTGGSTVSSMSLTATLPALLPGVLPTWLSTGTPSLTVTASEGGATAALALQVTASPGGQSLVFNVNSTLDFGAGTATLEATLAEPWTQPFGLSWLTLNSTTLSLAIDGAGSVDAALAASATAGSTTVSFDIAISGSDASLTAQVSSLTSGDFASLLSSVAGVTAPADLPQISLDTLTVEVDSATSAVSIAGSATIYGVSGSVLVSAQDRGEGREFLLGVSVDSVRLGDLPLGLSGAPADITLPDVHFAFADVPGASKTIAHGDLTEGERLFFDGAFGFSDSDSSSGVTLVSGLNLEASLAMSALPSALRDAVGLGSAGSATLAGSLGIDAGSVTSASLSASLPGTPTIPGMPDWFQGDSTRPFEVNLGYDGTVGTFGIAAGFLVTADGVDTVPFDVKAEISTAGSVSISGASTDVWATPFDQDWLTSLSSVGIEIVVNPGGESSATFSSEFTIGSTNFTLDLGITGATGSVDATFEATADQITDEDILALIQATGASTSGLSLPDVTARDIIVTASAGTSGFSFELGGSVDLLGQTNLDLVLSLVAGGDGTFRVVGGISASNLSLSDIVPSTAGTIPGDIEMETLALVISVGGEPVASEDLSTALRAFFDNIYGSGDYEVDLGGGITLVAAITVPEELEPVIEAFGGLTIDRLLLQGTIPLSFGSGGSSSSALSLTASVPRLEYATGGPDWFRYASFSLGISFNPTTSTFELSLDGELGVTITEDAGSTDLTFSVEGDLKAGPTGVSFSLGGGLTAENPWEQPFGIEWLTINGLTIFLSFDATTQGFGLELGGDAVLGTGPGAKQLAVIIGLELNVASGIPTNFVFQATSTSTWGISDLVALYTLIDPVGGELLDDIPDLQLRPIDDDTPITVKFALKNSPNVSAGFALKGSLWAEIHLDQPLEQVATMDIDISTAGIFLDGAVTIPILLGPATLENVHLDLDWVFVPPDFKFLFEADLTTEFFSTRIEARIPVDIDLNAALQDVLDEIGNIEDIWADLKPLLEDDPLAALNGDTIDDLYAAAGMETPEWISEVIAAIEALPNIEGVPVTPVALVNAVLGGFDVTIPAGSGYPTGGVAPGTCAPLSTGSNGHCYIQLPSAGVEQGFDTVQVCPGLQIPEGGKCWTIPPSITSSTAKVTACILSIQENGKCWILPPSLTVTVPKVTTCTAFLSILENGRCWTVPPSLTWTVGRILGVCPGVESGGTCYGWPPGPPKLASPSFPESVCPALTTPSGGLCYTAIPGPPIQASPGVPTAHCPIGTVESGGTCWWLPIGPPVEASGTPSNVQVCAIPGITLDGKCWKFGQTPTSGLPVGGFEPGCPLWAPFFGDGKCWTIPPTPQVKLISFPGLCDALDIACSLTGLIEDTIITPIIEDVAEDLTPFLAPTADLAPIATAGGPYTAPEGGSVQVTAAGSSDPEGLALTYAWDLDNDGQFDDATTLAATFSAASVDGPTTRTVSVRVTDPGGNSTIARASVEVTNVAPTLTVTGAASVDEAEEYVLTLSATDPGSETLTWSIDWGDGIETTASGNSTTATHVYTGNPTNPTIAVRASDEDGTYTASPLTITVIARSPSITAEVTSPVTEGGVATLAGSIDEPGGDDVLEFTVDWGDGETSTFSSPAGATSYVASHVYADDSSAAGYTIDVTATNEESLSSEASTTVVVENAAPTVEAEDGEGDEGSEVGLAGLISDAGSADSFTVDIDWGDGTSGSYDVAAADRSILFRHAYADDGTFTATVTVTDDDGDSGETTATFEIANVAPTVADLSLTPTAIAEGDTITLSGTIVEPGADSVTLSIDWGDGAQETFEFGVGEDSFSLEHEYLDDRTGPEEVYPILFSLTDDDGGSSEVDDSIGVANVSPDEVALTLDASAIDEAGEVTLSGTFVDPGTLDTFTVTIDWGDGTTPTVLELDAMEHAFEASHVYADDDPTGTGEDVYTISVDVLDDDGGTGSAETPVTVRNVAPDALSVSLDREAIDEDETTALSGTFEDPGVDDTFTVSIDWGDGSAPTILDLPVGARSFDASHRYLDDDPTATSADDYTISVEVLDDDGGAATTSTSVNVSNVDPSDVVLTHAAEIDEDGTLELSGTFVDPGTLDTFTVTVDWGDGTDVTVLELGPGERSFEASHHYPDDDPTGTLRDEYEITVTIVDDDSGEGSASSTFDVVNLDPVVIGSPVTATILSTETHEVEATFTDVGLRDTHTATIDWGDGFVETVTVSQSAGSGSLGSARRFVDPGTYTVVITVTDDDGGVGTSTLTLEVLGPQDLKESARVMLAPSAGRSKDVVKAMGEIGDSLHSALWQDVIRPDDQRGHSIFDRERHAIRALESALRKDGGSLGAAGVAAVEEAMDLLVTADWILVRVAYVDAEGILDSLATNKSKQVTKELDGADDAFQSAEAARAAGRHEDAIQDYRSAWQHFDRAFKHAGLR